MPVLTGTNTIHTKVIGVCEENRQGLLLDMFSYPEHVVELTVENDTVSVLFELDGMPSRFQLGNIKEKYFPFLQNKKVQIKQWQITGGIPMEGYRRRCTNLGINITIYFE